MVQSTMMALGTSAPAFELPDVVTGKSVKLSDFAGKKALLVMFICRHCPYVRHVKDEISKIGRDYKDKDVDIVAISSNDPERYPDDSPDSLKEFAIEEGFTFPLCFDQTQEVAKGYTAACTPDFFLFNRDRKLIYRGQLDSARPGNTNPVTGKDLRAAIDAVLFDQPVTPDQKPSSGCNIKWKPGKEPEYFTH